MRQLLGRDDLAFGPDLHHPVAFRPASARNHPSSRSQGRNRVGRGSQGGISPNKTFIHKKTSRGGLYHFQVRPLLYLRLHNGAVAFQPIYSYLAFHNGTTLKLPAPRNGTTIPAALFAATAGSVILTACGNANNTPDNRIGRWPDGDNRIG